MKVFIILMIIPFNGNCLKPMWALTKRPVTVAIIKARPETLSDKKIMLSSSASRLNIRINALLNPSIIDSILNFYFTLKSNHLFICLSH